MKRQKVKTKAIQASWISNRMYSCLPAFFIPNLLLLTIGYLLLLSAVSLQAQEEEQAQEHTLITRTEFRQLLLPKYRELSSRLAYFGGAGDTLDFLATSDWLWNSAYAANLVRHDEAKLVATAFYDRLAELGYTGDLLDVAHPWLSNTEATASASAPLTWGQALYLFNFSIDDIALDSDNDTLDDLWELDYFGHLGRDGTEDYDGDGVLDEVDSNPVRTDADGDGILDGVDSDPTDFYNGASLAWQAQHAGTPTALAFEAAIPSLQYELRADGVVAAHAPITVQALSARGRIVALNGLAVSGTVFNTQTDASGVITIAYQYGAPTDSTNQLLLKAADAEVIATIALDPLDDLDGDGLPSVWENSYGLNAMDDGSILLSNGAAGNPDFDAAENLVEYQNSTHPLVFDTGGNIIYVSSNDGADSNSGLSLADAKATVSEGLATVSEQGVLIVLEAQSAYSESILHNDKNMRLRIEGDAKISSQ